MKTREKMIIPSLLVLVLAVFFAVSCWGETFSSIDIRSKGGIGLYLVDSKGMTLYICKRDSRGISTCTGECAVMWPEFYSYKITGRSRLKASDFGVITRDDGKRQTTYKGMPLYYFAGDEKPGDTNGHGLYDIWVPASPTGIPGNLPPGDYR